MPVQIGATTHSFSEPTQLLSDCHRRISMFMAALQAVAVKSNQPLTDDFRKSLELALRYFREAAPKHTADEEDSLFPRLRRIQSADLADALRKLDALEEDHRSAAPLHETVDRLGIACLAAGSLSEDDSTRFRDAVSRLAEMYQRHIDIEDNQIFPVAARLLPDSEQKVIAQEMAARRNVKPIADIA